MRNLLRSCASCSKRDRKHVHFRHNVSATLNRLATVQVVQVKTGHLEAARKLYEESAEIMRQLSKEDPENNVYRRELEGQPEGARDFSAGDIGRNGDGARDI